LIKKYYEYLELHLVSIILLGDRLSSIHHPGYIFVPVKLTTGSTLGKTPLKDSARYIQILFLNYSVFINLILDLTHLNQVHWKVLGAGA